MKKIIDISSHNGIIDFSKVKKECDGVIIRCGYGGDYKSQDDKLFIENIRGCEKYKIPYGLYLFSYANNITKVDSEIKHFRRCINECRYISLGIWYDIEYMKYSSYFKLVANHFLQNMKKYYDGIIGIYASKSVWQNQLKDIKCNHKWIAQYNNKLTYHPEYTDAWQYTSVGVIDGIKGNVDISHWYVDYVELM